MKIKALTQVYIQQYKLVNHIKATKHEKSPAVKILIFRIPRLEQPPINSDIFFEIWASDFRKKKIRFTSWTF